MTTGVILDVNGHAVPDNTPVEFSLGYPGELPANVRTGTEGGTASISTTLGRLGLLSISAQSEPARASSVVQLNVQENMPAFVTVIAPTAVSTVTVEPAGADATPTPDGGGASAGGQGARRGMGVGALAAGLIGAAAVAALAYRSGTAEAAIHRGRLALVTLVFSLLGYNYIALGFPGAANVTRVLGVLAPGAIGVGTGLATWGFVHLWSM